MEWCCIAWQHALLYEVYRLGHEPVHGLFQTDFTTDSKQQFNRVEGRVLASHLGPCARVWLRVAACGCVWLRVAACGCVWLRVAACGCV
jgi:hypothetical protein